MESIRKYCLGEINGQIIPVIEWADNLYYGIGEDNQLVIYKYLDETYDIIY